MTAQSPLNTVDLDPGTGFPAELEADRSSMSGWLAGTLVADVRAGTRIPTPEEALRVGMGSHSANRNEVDKYDNVWNATERVKQFSVQRCVDVDPSLIRPAGVAYELVHVAVPEDGMAVVERLPTIFADVSSLDGNGVQYFTHGNLSGQKPCTNEILHADPTVTEPLRWQFYLQWTARGSIQRVSTQGTLGYSSGVPVGQIGGSQVLSPWSDMRYGHGPRWGTDEQYIFPRGSTIRTWVALFGPTDRFAVRIGQCLSGYTQGGGRKGAALDNILKRSI